MDDVSGYVRGDGYEFAYSRDFDGDGGLSVGWIASTILSPNPNDVNIVCWTWHRGDGPNDFQPQRYSDLGTRRTANEKYWLMTGRNPDESKYLSLRMSDAEYELGNYHFEQTNPTDTRYVYSFFGDQKGYDAPSATSFNLAPQATMKIAKAIVMGTSLETLKANVLLARELYGTPQSLAGLTTPDTAPRYVRLGPPTNEIETSNLVQTETWSYVFPNPVRNSDVRIHLKGNTDRLSEMEIRIFNVRGQLIKHSRDFSEDNREIVFTWDRRDDNGHEVPSGIYFYQIHSKENVETGRLLIVK
jgi:hypothetical protein